MNVSDLNEAALLARLTPNLPRGPRTVVGPGDDCAVINVPERQFVVTTDLMIDGLDFHPAWSTPRQIGARVAAQNLADIAAMGGRPIAVVDTLVVPGNTDADWLAQVMDGLGAAVRAAGAGIVGGDLSGGDQFSIALTVMGVCDTAPVLRSGAQVGDTVALAGTLGYSGTGLALLSGGYVDGALPGDALPVQLRPFVDTFRVPTPDLDAGPAAARAGAHAMMDVSDGLVIDMNRMAVASDVDVDLDRGMLEPFVEAVSPGALVAGEDPWHVVLTGGEDHPMLAAFASGQPLPHGFHPIGQVSARAAEHPQVRLEGRVLTHGGWDHFNHA